MTYLSGCDTTFHNLYGYCLNCAPEHFPKEFHQMTVDLVNHPPHYTNPDIKCFNCKQPIEAIDITEHFGFNLGNALKYIFRADSKGDPITDLKKASWYLEREIANRRMGQSK